MIRVKTLIISLVVLTSIWAQGQQLFKNDSDSISALLIISPVAPEAITDSNAVNLSLPGASMYGVILDWRFIRNHVSFTDAEGAIIDENRSLEIPIKMMFHGQLGDELEVSVYKNMTGFNAEVTRKTNEFINSKTFLSLINAYLDKLIIDNKVEPGSLKGLTLTLVISDIPK